MDLILFVPLDVSPKGQNLTKKIGNTIQNCDIQIISGFNALKARLKQVSIYEKQIFILIADSMRNLLQLTSLMDLMENKRLILVLPDDKKATVSMALQFCPRFFTCLDDSDENLCAVLTKMTQPKRQ